jgi:hypothetical protein
MCDGLFDFVEDSPLVVWFGLNGLGVLNFIM